MANLTDYLNTDISGGVKPVREAPSGSGAMGTALGALTAGMDVFFDRQRQIKQARKDAEKEALDAGERSAVLATIQAPFAANEAVAESLPGDGPSQVAAVDIGKLTSPEAGNMHDPSVAQVVFDASQGSNPEEVISDAAAAGRKIKSTQAGIQQGTMPGISLNAAFQREFQSLLNKYPEHAEKILETWKAMGLDHPAIRAMKAEQFEREAIQKQELEFREKAFTAGVEAGGDLSVMSRPEIEAMGVKEIQRRAAHDRLRAERELVKTNTEITATQKTQAEKDHNGQVVQQLFVDSYNAMAPIKVALQKAMLGIGKLPDGQQEAAFQQLAPMLEQMRSSYIERVVTEAVAAGYTENLNELRTTLETNSRSVMEPFVGEVTVAKANLAALNAIETRLKIDTAEALPMFTALKSLGIKAPEIDALISQGLNANPELMEDLRNEIKGFNLEFGRENASTRITNIVKLLKGQRALEDMGPEDQKRTLTVVVPSVKALAKQYNQGKDVDGNMILNGVGAVITATRTLGPTSSLNALYNATQGFAVPSVRKALTQVATNPNADTNDMGKPTLMAARAGSALILENIQAKINRGEGKSKFYYTAWDKKNGRYIVAKDLDEIEKARKSARPVFAERGLGAGVNKFSEPQPPQELLDMVFIANANLDNIMELKDYDPNTPKGTDLELRNYYGRNILPESLRQPSGKEANPQEAIDNILEEIRDAFETVPGISGEVELPLAQQYRNQYSGNEHLALTERIAAEMGIPVDIAVGLIGKESSFNPKAMGVPVKSRGGDRAMGLGQVMADEAASLGVSDRSSLTPEQQLRLAFTLLKQKYNEAGTGDWADAVSRYFTGVNRKQGAKRADANGTTGASYVGAIMGS